MLAMSLPVAERLMPAQDHSWPHLPTCEGFGATGVPSGFRCKLLWPVSKARMAQMACSTASACPSCVGASDRGSSADHLSVVALASDAPADAAASRQMLAPGWLCRTCRGFEVCFCKDKCAVCACLLYHMHKVPESARQRSIVSLQHGCEWLAQHALAVGLIPPWHCSSGIERHTGYIPH